MEIRKEQQGAERAELSREDLEQINALSKSELRAEEVYTFAVKLCDNEIDRDFERFNVAALEKLGELFVGKSGLFDHEWTAAGQTARIYKTELCTQAQTMTEAGDGYCYLKGYAYMLRSEKNAELIAEIEGGIKKEVSVGCSVRRSVCSICGEEMGECGHHKGMEYDGRLCFAELREPTDAYEWSFVAVPAQRGAGVMKKSFGCGGDLKRCVMEMGSAEMTKQWEEMERMAACGRRYLTELRREVKRLGLMTERSMSEETMGAIVERLEERELREMKKLYEEKAAKRFGVTTQLGRGERERERTTETVFVV